MSLTHNYDRCSSLVPLAYNFAVNIKSCVGFHTTLNAVAFPHIVGE
jgi:hypothetical protein